MFALADGDKPEVEEPGTETEGEWKERGVLVPASLANDLEARVKLRFGYERGKFTER